MSAISDLSQLIAHMEPELQTGEFVFCTFHNQTYGAFSELEPISAYQEAEGLTLIIPKDKADQANIAYNGTYRAITLQIHSALDAVGLTAAVATKLTEHNISANVIAAYFHDHIYVPSGRAAEAVTALKQLSKEAKKQ